VLTSVLLHIRAIFSDDAHEGALLLAADQYQSPLMLRAIW